MLQGTSLWLRLLLSCLYCGWASKVSAVLLLLSPLLKTGAFALFCASAPQMTGVLWKDYKGSWPPPHLDMGVTIHETWEAMVECYKAGLVRNIGVCNFKVRKIVNGKVRIFVYFVTGRKTDRPTCLTPCLTSLLPS